MIIQGDVSLRSVKRLNIAHTIFLNCPKCGTLISCDLDDSQLEYPEIGKEQDVTFHCQTCEENKEEFQDWALPVTLVSCEAKLAFDPKRLNPTY